MVTLLQSDGVYPRRERRNIASVDTAGRNFINVLATPGWRDCLNAYAR